MLGKMADATDTLWLEDYANIRNTFDNDTPGDQLRAWKDATKFYEENREAMDAGCEVSWDECFAPIKQEVSAIQHAYNILIDDGPAVFASECQNEPLIEESDGVRLTADEIASKKNGFKRLLVPSGCEVITASIDVHKDLLYYAIIAWENYFTGHIIDYGTYPEQKKHYFVLRDANPTMADVAPKLGGKGLGADGIIYAGLTELSKRILGKTYVRDDGAEMRVARCGVDANWGQQTDTVYLFCRQSEYQGILQPCHGKGVGPSERPLGVGSNKAKTRQSKRKEALGLNLEVRTGQTRSVRHCVFDTNYWKSFVHNRFSTGMGDMGCLSLWGGANTEHVMFSEHQVAEKPTTVEAKGGRTVDVWAELPSRPDNHLFDNVVGCCVQASIAGVRLHDLSNTKKATGKKLSLSELQAEKRRQRATQGRG
jgi:phage terminase large subunit GpA-like protein